MDFSTDSRGNILSMNYNETGGFSGELFAVSDNSGNIVAWSTILGINNYAAIRDPNNAYIDPIEIYNPNDINVPLGWNGKKGNNITIQQVGTGNDLIFNAGGSGFSITNPWGATDITDSTTTTTTDDTTDKDGGDDAEPCRDPDAPFENCMANCYEEKTGRDGSGWRRDLDKIDEYAGIVNELFNRGFEAFVGIAIQIITIYVSWILKLSLKALIALGVSLELFDQYVDSLKNKTTKELKERRDEMLKEDSWLSDGYYCEKLLNAMGDCYDICKQYIVEVD